MQTRRQSFLASWYAVWSGPRPLTINRHFHQVDTHPVLGVSIISGIENVIISKGRSHYINESSMYCHGRDYYSIRNEREHSSLGGRVRALLHISFKDVRATNAVFNLSVVCGKDLYRSPHVYCALF